MIETPDGPEWRRRTTKRQLAIWLGWLDWHLHRRLCLDSNF